MAKELELNEEAANASTDNIVDLLDAQDPTKGQIALVNAAGNVLGHADLNLPAFGDASGGIAAFNDTPTDVIISITIDGTITGCYFYDGSVSIVDGSAAPAGWVWKGSVGTTSEFDMTVSNTVVTDGDNVDPSSGTFTTPLV